MEELTPASAYVRISVLTEESDSLARQEHAIRQFAKLRGFDVVEVRRDEGVSGVAKVRPAYEKWLDDARSGRAKVLLAYHMDRVSRGGLVALASLLTVLDATGARLMTVADGTDSDSPAFRLTAAVVAEVASAEHKSIRRRVTDRHASDRRNGYWTMPRPFGYVVERGRLVPHPAEAPIVRTLVERATDGESLRGLAAWLTAEGVPTSRGGDAWGMTSIRRMLRNPVLAGWYPHNGQAVRDDETGERVSVSDAPILTPAEWVTLQAALDARVKTGPTGRLVPAVGGERKHELSGLLWHSCGYTLAYNSPRGRQRTGRFGCGRNGANRNACAGIWVNEKTAEEWAEHAVMTRLAALEPGSDAFEAVASRWLARMDPTDDAERRAAREAVTVAEAEAADLEAARYERGEFPGPAGLTRWQKLYNRALARLDAANTVLGAFPDVTDVGGLADPAILAEALHGGGRAARRDLFTLVLDRVTVDRAEGAGRVGLGGRTPADGFVFVPTWAGEGDA
nr:recombinase family protein [Micromonospora sp. 4G51]